MNLYQEIKNYIPKSEEEKNDKAQILAFMENNKNYLLRDNLTGHLTVSIWTVNERMDKVLMAYHNIYNSWSWIGGHADGVEDLKQVALRELNEETGVTSGRLFSEDILSIETLTVDGHYKRGNYVPSHLHFNVTYLVVADENEVTRNKEDENQAVAWFDIDDVLSKPSEKWMVDHIYRKLVDRVKEISETSKK